MPVKQARPRIPLPWNGHKVFVSLDRDTGAGCAWPARRHWSRSSRGKETAPEQRASVACWVGSVVPAPP